MERDMETLWETREEIDRSQQRLDSIPVRDEDVEGSDPARVVSVRVAADGTVRSITVDHRWQDHVAAADLADTIAAAYVTAAGERVGTWVTDVEDAFAMPAPRNRPLPTTVEEVMELVPDSENLTEEEVMTRIAELWSEIESELDGALADLEDRTTQVHRASSPDGTVHVELSASGGLQQLVLRESWLERAHPANIGRSILAVLEQAQASALAGFARTRQDADAAVDRLGRLGDPTRLARRAGLDV
ncbi:YbaB/EbfC family nucleoid-associated protein [Phycicoccus sp. CSK15P-2]|uniref:YbaB/EbfC family nucleoid-associated protein n=1 Tax=Phycicoccus sp. CSK15P-2 TaxID=2807627 RepID=UPI00194DB1A8|nr:YbaB/EbfC family nucleoid-associated protein [Phycicoccus sp. CSK15P-2]MBM6404972.1 YbaB/EbfC family nucleoid-associated protein [Phycicoccus sp. CSK15P-2]